MPLDSTRTHRGSKRLIYRAISLFILFFIIGQIIIIPLVHYELVRTPKFLGYITLEASTQCHGGEPEASVMLDDIPKGFFCTIEYISVWDHSIKRDINAIDFYYNRNDTEFNWLAKHAIIVIWSLVYGFTYHMNNNSFFFYNGTLEDYIKGINKIRSKVTYIDRVDGYLNIIVWGWVNDSTFDDVNFTEVTNRFRFIDLTFGFYMWRDERKAFEEISTTVYALIVIDILLIAALKRKAIVKASQKLVDKLIKRGKM